MSLTAGSWFDTSAHGHVTFRHRRQISAVFDQKRTGRNPPYLSHPVYGFTAAVGMDDENNIRYSTYLV
ncbi:hypothetical protein CU102_11715 [Phyllobacterium brassicacearum]|uniref:Uncharacterized protein n=1 Tax=Phyllobacterium brassicacearum TaxID=314235 RepID=A0A2P7BR29_9HYPH|nr:hypothetical protein CU102_11715 [Phyllobacterium brassicacearum]